MDFDKSLLLNNFFLNVRNQDWHSAAWYLYRYYASFGDGVVYTPQGLAVFLRTHIPISKRTAFRILEDLQKSDLAFKLDEFSLQLNPGLSMKGTNPIAYRGPKFLLSEEEKAKAAEMASDRERIWTLRGKHKRHIKEEQDMRAVLKKLDELTESFEQQKKQNADMQQQNAEIQKQNAEMMQILRELVSGNDVTEKAKRHLFLVKDE